jgi:ABC-type glycerol-3-phosphate transport system permease component
MKISQVGRSLTVSLLHGVLIVGAAVMIVPFVWTISSSFKTMGEIFNYPPVLIPSKLNLQNYSNLFTKVPFDRWYFNSLFLGVVSTALSVFFSSLAGYGFAKYTFRFQSALFSVLIASLIIPFQVVLIPLFVLMVKIQWIDSYLALIIPGMAPAFGIFLMRQYMVTIPSELLDAARIDGAGEFGIYWRIVLPLARPALGALTILQFMGSWNSFLWPLVVLRSKEKYTLPIGLANLLGLYQREYGMVMAGSFLVALPIIVLFFMMQKQFIAGLTLGSVKS